MSNFSKNKELILSKTKELSLKKITNHNQEEHICSILGIETSCVIYDSWHPVSAALAESYEYEDLDEFLESINLNYNPENFEAKKAALAVELDFLSREVNFPKSH